MSFKSILTVVLVSTFFMGTACTKDKGKVNVKAVTKANADVNTTPNTEAKTEFKVESNKNNPVLGTPKATSGGTFYRAFMSEPQKLNPITSTDMYARYVHYYTMDYLMWNNEETYKFQPMLAESMTMSDDGKLVTVKIRQGAKWHDGKPVTVEDVKFSYEAIVNGKYDTAALRSYFEYITAAKIIDKQTIVFTLSEAYFNNFNFLASLKIVPKHVYGDPKKKNNKILVGSGPYKLDRYNKGRSIVLKKNKDWWGWDVDLYKNKFKPDKVFIRFVKDDNVRLEMLKKGQIDYFMEMPSEIYVKKAVGKLWGTKVHKKKVRNDKPKKYGFVAWNFKSDLFTDRRVRVALAHLMDRERMNKLFRYGASDLATGPWYKGNPFASKKVKPFLFDLKKAKELLTEAGWVNNGKDPIREKTINGVKKKFKFTLMFPSKNVKKYFTTYRQDLLKAGIEMDLKIVDWATFIKALDEKKFDAVSLAWGAGSIEHDPKQIWHTDSAKNKGSNFISYSNKEVDRLIMKARKVLDFDKRVPILNKVYELIAADAPYAFMFNDVYEYYGVSDKVKMDKPTYAYDISDKFWYMQK